MSRRSASLIYLVHSPGIEPGNTRLSDVPLYRSGCCGCGAQRGNRTPSFHLVRVALYRLSYPRMVRRAGFEPATPELEARCSESAELPAHNQKLGFSSRLLMTLLLSPGWPQGNRTPILPGKSRVLNLLSLRPVWYVRSESNRGSSG